MSSSKLSQFDKRFIKKFEDSVKKTIKQFKLLNKKEKIIVAVSGGKDSSVVLYLLKKFGYDVEALTIDVLIGEYTKKNLENIKKFCKELDVKLHVVSFRDKFGYSLCGIRSVIKSKGLDLRSCTVCGVMRRYLINKHARKLKAEKVATGHTLDDEAQSIFMNLMRNYNDRLAKLGPIAGTETIAHFVPRVKPLYIVSESDTERYSRLMGFPVQYGRCPCAVDAFRNFVRNYLSELEKSNKNIKKNIVDFFLDKLPDLKKSASKANSKLTYCRKCGEPARLDTCRTCRIIDSVCK